MNTSLNHEPKLAGFHVALVKLPDQPREEMKTLLLPNVAQEEHFEGAFTRSPVASAA